MDEQLFISTPEQVAFSYETAGIGSRSLAALLDHLIIIVVLVLMNCALSLLMPAVYAAGFSGDDAGATGVYVLLAVLTLIQFLFLWGYFVLFEIVWRGRTPGKRAAKLRVLRRDGHPIGVGEAVIRNLVRLVDFLPVFYGIGLISMFADKESRRLGDFAAGTIVVKESEQVALRDVRVAGQPTSYVQAPYSYDRQGQLSTQHSALSTQENDPLPGISLHNVTGEDYRLIREVMERVNRGEIESVRGQELASRLAYGLASRMGFDYGDWRRRGWEPVVFLQSVLRAHDLRGD